jgi:AI-2 transport protein TqsA
METYQKINTICIFILTIFASALALYSTKSVMIPFVLSVFMYLIISPFMGWMQNKFKIHHSFVLIITIILFLSIVLLLTLLTSTSIDSFLQGASQYKGKVQSAASFIELKANHFGYDLTAYDIKGKLQSLPIFSLLKGLTGSMLSMFSNSILVTIFTLFLLTGESVSKHELATFEEVKRSIAKYVSTKLLLSLVTGGLSYLVFLIAGVDLAIMFAIFTILLNFIPNIGSIVAVILPIPVLLLQFGFGWQTILVIISTSIFQVVIGNILEPKMMGESMDLHPVTILLFLTFWGFIWGVPGMFLSVPITATLKIIFSKMELTKPISELFAGRFS